MSCTIVLNLDDIWSAAQIERQTRLLRTYKAALKKILEIKATEDIDENFCRKVLHESKSTCSQRLR